MAFDAKILADSFSPDDVRLTTFEVTMPRIVLAEFNTHRVFSRNSASSRAIPVQKIIERVQQDPYIPTSWGKNQKGMQAEEELSVERQEEAKFLWLRARDQAVNHALALLEVGLHKQFTNRLLETWMWQTVIVTATEWSNWDHLRNNNAAHPDIQIPARMLSEAHEKSKPAGLDYGDWHLPLIQEDELLSRIPNEKLCKISIARCARVSYLTHDGKRDHEEDIKLYERLTSSGHMSPLEHVARPMTKDERRLYATGFDLIVPPDAADPKLDKSMCGNLRGWVQYRKTIPNEHDMLRPQ